MTYSSPNGTKEVIKHQKLIGVDFITYPEKEKVFLTFNSMHAILKARNLTNNSYHRTSKGSTEVTSYRPINLLQVLSKLYEKLVLRRINNIFLLHIFQIVASTNVNRL